LLDEHLGAVGRSEPARPGGCEERRLGRHVDQVEDGGRVGQRRDVDRHPRVDHPHGRGVDGEVGRRDAIPEGVRPEAGDESIRLSDAAEAVEQGSRPVDGPCPDRHPRDAGRQQREHDRVGGTAGAGDDDICAGQRSTRGELDTCPEPRRIAVEPDESAVVGPDHVVDGTDHLRVALDLIDQPGDHLLVRRGHAQPEPPVAARVRHDACDRIRLDLPEHVPPVDAAGIERGVVHDL
jgi:hypothetical protein